MNWPLLINSMLVAVGAMALSVAFGFFVALWATTVGERLKKLILAGAIAALALPPFLVTNCWIDLLGQTGTWRRWLPLDIFSLGGTIWILALLSWPVTFLFVSAAWRRVEKAQLEVDPMLRGNALIRWLLFPMARSALVQAGVLTSVLALNNFAVPAILQVKVFPAELWVSFNTTFDYATALKLCWPMVLAPVLALIVWRRSEMSWDWRSGCAPGKDFRRQLGAGWLWTSAVLTLIAVVFSLIVPCWQLAGSAVTWRELGPAFLAGQSALLHSAGFAAGVATAVVVFAFLTWRYSLDSILWLPFFVPGVLLGIGIIWVFNRPGLSFIYQSIAIVIVGYFIRYSALGWNCVARATRGADRTLTDAARLEGANAWQMLRHVYWPQIAPQVAVGWYITYLLGLWDVETLVLIVPPGNETAALRIFNLLHYGHNSQVNALCLLLLFLALLPLMGVWGWRSWTFASQKPVVPCTPEGCQKVAGVSSAARPPERGEEENPTLKGWQKRNFPISGWLQTLVAPLQGATKFLIGLPRAALRLPWADLPARFQRAKIGMRTVSAQGYQPRASEAPPWGTPHKIKARPEGARVASLPTDSSSAATLTRILCGLFATRNLKYLLPLLLLTACSEPQDKQTVFPVQSQFFTQVRVIGTRGTGAGQFNKPRSVAVDAQDNLYVIDMTGRLQKFSPDGEFLSGYQMPQTEKGKAKGMSRDKSGNIVVLEPHYTRVNHFTPELKLAAQWGVNGTNDGQLAFPRGIAVNSKDEVYVSEYSLVERVQRFSARGGKWLGTFGKPGDKPGELNRAEGLGIDAQDRVYVADSCNHRVQVFSSDGKFLRTYGKAGVGNGELSYPYDVRVDAAGYQFVCEFGNSRIQIFDPSDRSVEIIGKAGGDPGQFSNPWAICFDSKGNLYVADAMNHRVQKFIRKGLKS